MNEIELSIVMPCLNEALTLATCITKAKQYLSLNNINGEVIIADNGSNDGSQEIAEANGAILVIAEKKGYGSALITGFDMAKGKYIIMGDADDSYDFSALDNFTEKLRAGNEMVIGNRFSGGIEKDAMPFLHRYLGNPVLSSLGRLFFRQKVRDFHCGLRGITKKAVLSLNLESQGMEFASEMIVKASLKGYKIAEVPTKLYKDGRDRRPHLRTWHDGWRHLKFLLLLCPRWLFLYPGVAMVVTGFLLSILLSFNQIEIGRINFGIHTLFYASVCYLIGFQLAMFYFFSRLYWSQAGIYSLNSMHKKILSAFSIEKGLMVGISIIFIGIILLVFALEIWKISSFSSLEPASTFKIIIPSGFSIMLGFQIIFASLFINMLGRTTNNGFKDTIK